MTREDKMEDKFDTLRQELADFFYCEEEELRGRTIRDVFLECERISGTEVYWGCWEKEELEMEL